MKPAPRITITPFPPARHQTAERIILDFGIEMARGFLVIVMLVAVGGLLIAVT